MSPHLASEVSECLHHFVEQLSIFTGDTLDEFKAHTFEYEVDILVHWLYYSHFAFILFAVDIGTGDQSIYFLDHIRSVEVVA